MARRDLFQPLEAGVTKGPRATFGETAEAMFRREQEVGELTSRPRFEREVYKPLLDQMEVQQTGPGPARVSVQGQALSARMAQRLTQQRFAPDDTLLTDLFSELETRGIQMPEDVTPEKLIERRDSMTEELLGRVERSDEVLRRSRGASGLAAQLAGGFAAGFDNVESVVTMPFGAASRAGILATAMIEGTINAATEAATTPARNTFLRDLGLPEESIIENAAFGFAVGGTLGAGLRSMTRLGQSVRARRKDLVEVAEASGDPEIEAIGKAVRRDIEDQDAAAGNEPDGIREHITRGQAAADAAAEGGLPEMPDRPVFAQPRASIISGEIEEVDPRELLVQPKVFQFKSEIVDETQGTTPKLSNVTEWRSERAGVTLVYEYADGSRAVADGHQRTALAKRIMDQTGDEIRLAARVYREVEGFTPEDVRTLAALKNISEAADGMTAAMASDAARVLRVDPDAINDLPAGPGIVRAQSLARLSDEAFDMFINEVVPERFSELVGRNVQDPAMHAPVMQLLSRARPETVAQAESIIDQALQAPVSREVTTDLFGEQEVVESLYLERAKVLERAMRIMRDDRAIFRTLDERAARIQGAGQNRLDTATNKQTRQQVEQALAAVQKLAHRAGPISEALNDGAKGYKETGRLKDAAQRVADAVRQEIERNGLSGAGAGPSGRGAEPPRSGAAAPDPLEGFSDPVGGEAVRAQVEATRIDPLPPSDLRSVVERGATPEEIEAHPDVISAIAEMRARSRMETVSADNYGSPEWHVSREYIIDGNSVIGTEKALPLWLRDAMSFAGDEGPRTDRIATILLGPPAAGKSTIAESIAISKRAAILDSDEIKKTLPEYDGGIGASAVHEESSALSRRLEDALRGMGANMIVPKVGGSPGSIRNLSARLKADGYTVEVVNMAVSPEEAYRRMIDRFVETGRIIPPDYVRATGDNPSKTFKTLKEEGTADGYAEIDNNGGRDQPKNIREVSGKNPLANTSFDLEGGGGEGIRAVGVRAEDGGEGRGENAGRDAVEQELNIFDAVPVGRGFDADGNEVAVTMTRQELAADLDADDEALAVLELCVRG